ncbi:hypothetical protein K461DRAFT_298218 [Myriangium duriaei CBS 260.36]|uniref:Uncharacterized protein n=1 Tax=Myriangium duriaei CBS 260.36 TaxID=1168546 RepID=A0A9P4IWG4_9PEZI|nr:hypothetical protein K461DRAFT_298218 [Myriangium duriaei CBS 260.36]
MDIALAQIEPDGFFCCAAWGQSITNGNYCFTSTQGSVQPFTLPQGRAIYDRATGTILNDTAQSALNSPALPTEASPPTNSSSPSTSSSPTSQSETKSDTKVAAVGAGVGVPLGLACAGMLFLLLLERKKRKAAEARVESMSGPNAFPHYDQRAPSYGTSNQAYQQELPSSNTRFEIGGGQRPTELETPSEIVAKH